MNIIPLGNIGSPSYVKAGSATRLQISQSFPHSWQLGLTAPKGDCVATAILIPTVLSNQNEGPSYRNDESGNCFKLVRSSFLVAWRRLLFVYVVWIELRTCRDSVGVHASEAQFWGSSGQMPTAAIMPDNSRQFTITERLREASLGDGLSQERRKAWLCAAMEGLADSGSLSTELECLLLWRLLLGVLRYELTKVGVPRPMHILRQWLWRSCLVECQKTVVVSVFASVGLPSTWCSPSHHQAHALDFCIVKGRSIFHLLTAIVRLQIFPCNKYEGTLSLHGNLEIALIRYC